MTITSAHPQPASTGRALLSGRIMARISGPGTDQFIQGQFSQNIGEVTPARSLRAAACTPKGRAYCVTRLVRDDNDVLLFLEKELAEQTIQHLNKYLMLFRGTSLERVEHGQMFGLIGADTAAALTDERQAASLTDAGQVAAGDFGYLIRVEDDSDGNPRFELWQPSPGASLPDTRALTPEQWQASEISAGVPWLTTASHESYIPQMLNLQHLQGIHFKKGCYTGQEVIARMHFLGQLKKSLFRLGFSGTDCAPLPGTRITSESGSPGEVVNAAMTGEDHGELLAVLRHDASNGILEVEGHPEIALTLLPLPYSVPEREAQETPDT
ncbi:folate-binding protein [Marinobacter fuscus]|uniref:Folate-binding protein n=1 Tax=Marinobacter fuscus TaxID=2109942 RepID=A0A2T1KKI2_9GAMM|nr:folate-binding protein YgfZ [Marinobacter fuscus]PSF10654.1 folate-binding protein [Marinobacter fuscus]